jgi:hypothetical protein
MSTVLKWFGIIIGIIVLAVALFLVGMRFHDGPMEVFTGGPFKSGMRAPMPDDWGFLKDTPTIQFQTMDPARSRLTWCVVNDGHLYVMASFMGSRLGHLLKKWPGYLEKDNRVILRTGGKLYDARMKRVKDAGIIKRVHAAFVRKYHLGNSAGVISDWMWEVEPR